MVKKSILTVLCLICVSVSAHAAIKVEDLVDEFMLFTEVQQVIFEDRYVGEIVEAEGAVQDVLRSSHSDEVTAIKGDYYKVTTEAANTLRNNRYKIIFCYENKQKAMQLTKGEVITNEGPLLKIVNWKLFVAVWIYVQY